MLDSYASDIHLRAEPIPMSVHLNALIIWNLVHIYSSTVSQLTHSGSLMKIKYR